MSCGAIRKQKYTDSTLLESTEAGKFEVACSAGEIVILLSHFLLSSGSFNMALSRANCALKPLQSLSKWTPKNNDCNEHEQKKSPLTSTPLCSRPHSLLFSPSKSILFLRHCWLTHRRPKVITWTRTWLLQCKRCCVTNGYLQRIVWDVNGFS